VNYSSGSIAEHRITFPGSKSVKAQPRSKTFTPVCVARAIVFYCTTAPNKRGNLSLKKNRPSSLLPRLAKLAATPAGLARRFHRSPAGHSTAGRVRFRRMPAERPEGAMVLAWSLLSAND
jgi:hypothetical protein